MFSLAIVAVAQDDAGMVSKVEALKYPALSRQARIQGNVSLRSGPKGVEVISGHPLLVTAALDNLRSLGKLSEIDVEVVYHFVLVDAATRITRTTVKKGDAFDRLILRALRMKTEKVVEDVRCVENPDQPKNRIDLTKNPVEVWIYGSIACVQVEASYVASR